MGWMRPGCIEFWICDFGFWILDSVTGELLEQLGDSTGFVIHLAEARWIIESAASLQTGSGLTD
jgi:hypothetical protein